MIGARRAGGVLVGGKARAFQQLLSYAPPGQGEAAESPGRPVRHGPIGVHMRFNLLRVAIAIRQRPAADCPRAAAPVRKVSYHK